MRNFAILRTRYTVSYHSKFEREKLTILAILHDFLIKLDSLYTSISRNLPISGRTKVLVIILLTRTSRYRFRTNWYTFTILSNKVEITRTSAAPKGWTYHS
jgi:hypothetical protein